MLQQHKEQGVAHLGVIVLTVVVIAAVAFGGWWVFVKNKQSSTIDEAVQQALQNAKCDYEDKDLCKFFAGWKAQKHYTLTSTSEVGGAQNITTLQVENNDKYYLRVSGDVAYEIIKIGNSTYTKAADGTWWKQTDEVINSDDPASDVKVNFEEPSAQDETGSIAYNKLDKEPCDNFTCFKYEIIYPGESNTNTYIWFDDKDYQLRRTKVIVGDTTTLDATFNYDKFTISEPSPVKELGPGQYIAPGQSEPITLPTTGDLY